MSEVQAIVSLQAVSKHFGNVAALDSVDIEIKRGEFVSLLGPSGCGKTTLLRVVAGLETLSSGRVFIDGKDVTNRPPQARDVGFVFQRYALFPHLNVVDNIAFGLRVKGVAAAERRKKALEMLELVRLPEIADRMPDEISGGQAQRVALARALALQPSVLLLDEPLSALDLAIRNAMQEELRRIHRELGTTFVFVTHDQGEALTMSDRVLLINRGRVVQDSKPSDLYSKPSNLFAAKFVGDVNLWEGKSNLGQGDRVEVRTGGESLVGVRAKDLPSEDVAYVLRPEQVSVTRGNSAVSAGVDGDNFAVYATVFDIIHRGPVVTLLTDTDGGLRLRVQVSVGEAEGLRPGDRIHCSWPIGQGQIFPLYEGGA